MAVIYLTPGDLMPPRQRGCWNFSMWQRRRSNSNSFNAFSLYRVDGNSIVDEAVVSGTTNRSLGSGFVASEFAVDLFGISRLESTIAIGTSNFSTPASVRKTVSSPAAISDSASINVIDNSHVVNFAGPRSVGILGMPTTPRIGILQDVLIDAVEAGNYATGKIDWLSLTPGEHKTGAARLLLPMYCHAFRPLLTRDVPLLFESDAPCCCALNQFQVSHVLRNTLFGDAQVEKLLRFSGVTVDSQQITLTLPRGVIDSVSMAINDAAQDALIEDRNGTPSGSVLATAVRQIERVGVRQFVNVPFDAAKVDLLLDQKAYWLLVRATPAASPQRVLLLKDLQSSTAISAGLQTTRAIAGIALEFGWILNRMVPNTIDISFSIERQPVPLQDDPSAARRHFLQLPLSACLRCGLTITLAERGWS